MLAKRQRIYLPNKPRHGQAGFKKWSEIRARGPFKGDTLTELIRIGRRFHIWSEHDAAVMRKQIQNPDIVPDKDKYLRDLRESLQFHGVRLYITEL